MLLLLKHVSWIRDYTPAAATTGEPLFYALFDNNSFILAPAPNSDYTFELHYFYRPISLVDSGDSGSTWLSTNASNTLLYGSLVEAAIFMKLPPAEIQTFDVKYQEGLEKDYFSKRADGPPMKGKVWPGECYFPDYTKPEVREWWASLFKELIEDIGVKVSMSYKP